MKQFTVVAALAVVIAISFNAPAGAQGSPSSNPYSDHFWTCSSLSGDWGGLRIDLAAKGVTVDMSLTQVGQGIIHGGKGIITGRPARSIGSGFLLHRYQKSSVSRIVTNEIVQHHDWLPTFLAMAGEPDINQKLLQGYEAAGKKFKVHIDGYNLLPFLTEKGTRSPRKGFIYFDDDGDLVAVRFDNWKVVFMEQRCAGTLAVWSEPFVPLRLPKLYNLRTDPFERADTTSNTYYDWFLSKLYMIAAAGAIVEEFLATFKEYPPRQRAATFTIDQVLEKMYATMSGAGH